MKKFILSYLLVLIVGLTLMTVFARRTEAAEVRSWNVGQAQKLSHELLQIRAGKAVLGEFKNTDRYAADLFEASESALNRSFPGGPYKVLRFTAALDGRVLLVAESVTLHKRLKLAAMPQALMIEDAQPAAKSSSDILSFIQVRSTRPTPEEPIREDGRVDVNLKKTSAFTLSIFVRETSTRNPFLATYNSVDSHSQGVTLSVQADLGQGLMLNLQGEISAQQNTSHELFEGKIRKAHTSDTLSVVSMTLSRSTGVLGINASVGASASTTFDAATVLQAYLSLNRKFLAKDGQELAQLELKLTRQQIDSATDELKIELSGRIAI